MATTQISVRPETASAFQAATPKQQRRAEVAMLQSLIGRAASIERLEQIMDAMSATAHGRGMTDERLVELLNDPD